MTSSSVLTSTIETGRVLHLVFEDRSSRNSFSLRAARELKSILAAYSGQYDFLIFSSIGRVFCSGGNLSDYAAMGEASQGQAVNREITDALDELARLPVPTFSLVQGDAIGC